MEACNRNSKRQLLWASIACGDSLSGIMCSTVERVPRSWWGGTQDSNLDFWQKPEACIH
jgi:hypothetical protein